MCYLGTWFRRDHGGARLKVKLDDSRGLFQPKLLCDTIILIFFIYRLGARGWSAAVRREMAFLVDGKLNMTQP